MKLISLFISLLIPLSLVAQVSEEEHLSHHPELQGEQPASQPRTGEGGGGMGGMMGDMGGMMEKMGVPPPKDTYPKLMDLPRLPDEERAAFELDAHERMKRGASAMTAAMKQLTAVASGSDFAGMQEATTRLREGLAQFESGLAAHRALREGQPPRSVSLQWFKKEMNLTDAQTRPSTGTGFLGLGWFHALTMLFLVMFAIVMVWMYYHKMSRAAALVGELTEQAKAQAQSPAPLAEPSVSRPAPQASTSANSPAAPASQVTRGQKWTGTLKVGLTAQETPEVRTLRLVDPAGGPIPFDFRPGQFATVSVEIEGKRHKRSYTIASSPTQRDYIELTVKREPEGAVSRFLNDTLQESDTLELTAPLGKFTFDGSESPSIVLIGGGVGITPLMTVVRYLTDRAWPGEIVLLYSCRTSNLFIYREELEFLQHRHANLKVVATMTRDPGTDWMGLQGHLTRETIASVVPDIAARRIHLCGPQPMMDAIQGALAELGVPPESVMTEAFGAPAPRASSPPKPQLSAEQSAFAVRFNKSGKSGTVTTGQTVLDLADDLGIEIENSCRVGTCGSCRVKLIAGSVQMESDDGLDPEEKASGYILACQATPTSELTVEE